MAYQHIQITREQPNIGATISGVDLNRVSNPAVYEEIRQALMEFGVVFFRDQPLTPDAHVALAAALGSPEVHEFFPAVKTNKEISIISVPANTENKPVGENGTDRWHADVTFREDPSFASILRGVDVPFGGDTMWVNMNAVYNNLPDKMKQLLEGLEAEHDALGDDAVRNFVLKNQGPEGLAEFAKRRPPKVHPVVISHPITGKPILYVNSVFTQRLLGLPDDLAKLLLHWLYELPKIPEYQVRFKWEPNSIAIWDNFVTQHYAVNDYKDYREMQRVVVSGMKPTEYAYSQLSNATQAGFIDSQAMQSASASDQDAIRKLFAG